MLTNMVGRISVRRVILLMWFIFSRLVKGKFLGNLKIDGYGFISFERRELSCSHVHHEGNQVADRLVSNAIHLIATQWWWSASNFCSAIITRDVECNAPAIYVWPTT